MTIISVGLGYSFARQQLACLDAFVGGPVWVLGPTRRPLNVSGLMVSLTLRDLQQLWGPVWLVGGTEDAAPAIRTERGFIIPVSRNKQKTSQPKDIICHWTRDLPDSFLREKLPEDRIFIDTESKLIIGLGESEHTMGITVNKQCQADINLIQQQIEYELKLPGTCEAHYVGEGYEVNLTGGYQVNVGLTKKFKRMPARTHKSALIAYCTSPNAQLLPVLKLMVGLEVSACTGNSRRVSLWDVIQLTRVKEKAEGFGYIQAFCDHPAGSIECIGMCWAQDRGQIDEIVDIPGDETFKKAAARRELINAILALEHTGINHKGVLQAFWPFSECPQVCCIGPSTRVRKNNWLRVVKDTPDTSTFAALSQRCLGMAYSFSIVPLSGCFQQYIPQPLPTALCTRVFIKDPNGEFVHEMTHGNHLRIGELKLDAVIMQPGDPHVVVARVRQARLSSWVGNGIKVQEHVSRHNPVSRLVLVITF
ncbi:hypothetical protein BDW59DRAFT_165405 [Aspergillus cavernicola]|uniref:Uncharacterized protein n=1 Tax=Aspergillus cavernicola TaxID=176166 RepID=A0ABR4HTD2_9EURO